MLTDTCNTSATSDRNIVLVGFMGSGKTSVGALIAKRLDRDFIDTDALIEERAGKCIPDIFAEQGENAFRDLETAVILEAAKRSGVVISTGGGVVLRRENIEALKASGQVILLDATPEAIVERIGGDEGRPLLQTHDPAPRIHELLDARRPYYLQADAVVDTTGRTVEEAVEETLALMRASTLGHRWN